MSDATVPVGDDDAPRAHVFATHADCASEHDDTRTGMCPYADGDLALCTVCGLAEGELTTDCPGERTSRGEEVYAGLADFVGGRWVTPANARDLRRALRAIVDAYDVALERGTAPVAEAIERGRSVLAGS